MANQHPVNQQIHDNTTTSERFATSVVQGFGSVRFIVIQTCVVLAWFTSNAVGWALRWDPYPFILLNLGFSLQAAYAAPLILLAQNKQTERDRLKAEHDYRHQDQALRNNTELTRAVHALTAEIHAKVTGN